jgi:hypothetical protein
MQISLIGAADFALAVATTGAGVAPGTIALAALVDRRPRHLKDARQILALHRRPGDGGAPRFTTRQPRAAWRP